MNISNTKERLIGFIHHLRGEGYKLGIREVLDTLDTVSSCDIPDELLTRNITRSLACQNHEDWIKFNAVFNSFWHPEQISQSRNTTEKLIENIQRSYQRRALSGLSGSADVDSGKLELDDNLLSAGAGRQNTISKADFRFITDKKAAREAEILAERLSIKLCRKLKRKRQLSRKGKNIDIRRTFRSNIKFAGEPVYPLYSVRKKEPPHLVILHDVSHSMTWNNPLLFRFARGLVRTFPNCEAFAFHTHLFPVTHLYRERSLEIMRARLENQSHLWMGGTCIADSLSEFLAKYAKKSLKPSTQVIIISDGFDTNAPEQLGKTLSCLRKMAGRIIWLNPMLGRSGFSRDENFTRHISEHVDLFQPAHSLETLESTVNFLAKNL